MKKILSFLLAIIGLCGYSQDEYYRKVDWKFYPENVIQLTDSTYLTDAYPFDYNDVGAIQRVVGNYVVDFVGHRYEVIDSTTTTITVLDIYHIGQAPQTGQIARCYRSVGDGEAEYVGSIDYSPLDESSRWKLNGSDNELLWRQTLGKAENGLYKDLRTAKLGGNLIEPTTIDQDNNSFKILNNGHGSVFSETGIAYTQIDTVDFTDSTLVTKMYVKSLIKEGTGHDSLTIAPGSTGYFEVNYPQIFSGQKLIDSLGVINTKIAGKEPLLTKGNLTAGSSKITIGGTGTNALIGVGASVDVNEANIVHQNLSGSGTNTHAQIDAHITNDGDLSSTNEIQDLSLSGNTLSLSGDASTVDLSGYAPAGNYFIGGSRHVTTDNLNTSNGIGAMYWVPTDFNRPAGSGYGTIFNIDGYSVGDGLGWNTQLAFNAESDNRMFIRKSINNNTSWSDWKEFYHSGNANLSTIPWDAAAYKLSGVDLYSSLTANTLEKWDGTKHTSIPIESGYFYSDGTNTSWIKTVPQSLSGTTPSLSASNGVNANLSISGATTLTLSNLISGTSGTIYLTNNASVYRIKIAGYTIAPASNITYDSTGILLPASSVYTHTSIGWYYNGTTVQIHKADYNTTTY